MSEITEFDPVWGKALARACSAAYSTSADSIAVECSGDKVEPFSFGPVFGYVAHFGQKVVVAFRGTVSPVEEWERAMMQWVANIDFHQIAAHGGRVHRGFFQALDEVWVRFHELLKNHLTPDSQLWITGHSLGGALAILAGVRLHEAGVETTGIYTFGAPAVGDAAFANGYRPVLHRIENSCDIVCHLPPPRVLTNLAGKLFGSVGIPTDIQYHPVGTMIDLDEDGSFVAVRSLAEKRAHSWLHILDLAIGASADLPCLLEDHRITNYVSRLGLGRAQRSGSLYRIPRRLVRAVGSLRGPGPVIRNASGKVVAFIQETIAWQKAIGGGRPGGLIQNAGNLVSAIRTDPQLVQFAGAMSNLQLLGAANLAASVVGIGVSIAGFALVLNRLQSVGVIAREAREAAIGARLASERLEFKAVAKERSDTLSLLERADDAWTFPDPVSQWKQIEFPLYNQLNYEQTLVGKAGTPSIFLDPNFSFEESVEAYESLLLLNTAHFQVLMLAEGNATAKHFAEKFHEWHRRAVVDELRPGEISDAKWKQLAGQSGLREIDARTKIARQAEAFMEKAVEIHRHARCRIELINFLQQTGESGLAYIKEARERTDTPVLVLPVG